MRRWAVKAEVVAYIDAETPAAAIRAMEARCAEAGLGTQAGMTVTEDTEWHGLSRVVGHYAGDCPGPVMCDWASAP